MGGQCVPRARSVVSWRAEWQVFKDLRRWKYVKKPKSVTKIHFSPTKYLLFLPPVRRLYDFLFLPNK